MRIIDRIALAVFARKTAESASDFASMVHNLIMDVRDSYRPELHYMRGPGPKWRAKHQPWLKFNSQSLAPAGHYQLLPVYEDRRDAANPTR
ncbi:hypothetical protein ACVWYQ_006647 [Bradyrhizobium sp. USDA 3397]